jgi:hypothetical protein
MTSHQSGGVGERARSQGFSAFRAVNRACYLAGVLRGPHGPESQLNELGGTVLTGKQFPKC